MTDKLKQEAGDRVNVVTKHFTNFYKDLPRRVIMNELEEEIG